MKKVIAFVWKYFVLEFLHLIVGTTILMGLPGIVLGPMFGIARLGDEGYLHPIVAFACMFGWLAILSGLVKWSENNNEINRKNQIEDRRARAS